MAIILLVLIPTISLKARKCNFLIWFIYLYAIFGYIKLYLSNIKISGKEFIVIALWLVYITFLFTIIYDFIGLKILSVGRKATRFYGMQQLPIVMISIFLFIGFLNLKIKYNKIINLIATATFGMHLIHDNVYVRDFLWNVLFEDSSLKNSIFLIPYSLLIIAIVFCGCTIIELFRIHIIEKSFQLYTITF